MKQLTIPINGNDHVAGSADAVLELVEYGDYECPYCGRAFSVVKGIERELRGDIKIAFRHFPLVKIHPHAFEAAVAAEAAARQGKFWAMHEMIFRNQKTLESQDLLDFADKLQLDLTLFQKDKQDPLLTDKINGDFESGLRSGVNRTPSFYINGEKYEGDWADDGLMNYLQELLIRHGIM